MASTPDIWQLVNERGAAELAQLKSRFESADPFPHIVVDDFFTEAFFSRLQHDFPPEGEAYDAFRREDDGKLGSNYANGDVASFPPAYATLDALMQDVRFRHFVSAMTGIDQLEYDPDYFGGGIRESRSGTFLPPHLDFNHHPKTKHHRRMNLLFYLNDEWEQHWGGNLQVHKDPNVFRGNDSLVQSYMPVRNRCLIFETSETSWHGFDRLQLPEGRTRRAFTVYYYTERRPNEDAIKFHNTEYVELPLPAHFQPGHVLTQADVTLLQEYITRRDGRIRMLYDLRMQLDEKLRHVWKEYEYYEGLSKQRGPVKALDRFGRRVVNRLKRGLGNKPPKT